MPLSNGWLELPISGSPVAPDVEVDLMIKPTGVEPCVLAVSVQWRRVDILAYRLARTNYAPKSIDLSRINARKLSAGKESNNE
jgi:hypothetical protein